MPDPATIPRVPDENDSRHRRAHDLLATIFNDLIRGGVFVPGPGGSWVVNNNLITVNAPAAQLPGPPGPRGPMGPPGMDGRPGTAGADGVPAWSGVRPTFPDHRPALTALAGAQAGSGSGTPGAAGAKGADGPPGGWLAWPRLPDHRAALSALGGLGGMAAQQPSAVNITGGSVLADVLLASMSASGGDLYLANTTSGLGKATVVHNSGANTTLRILDIRVNDANRVIDLAGDLIISGSATVQGTNTGNVGLAGETYLTISGQTITAHPVDLAGSNVTGILPRANLPATAACRVRNSTDQSHGSSGSWVSITFDTEDVDTDGFHSTVTNTSRVTIPTGLGGVYAVTGDLRFAAAATGGRGVRLLKNGATVVASNIAGGFSADDTNLSIASILSLAAGDYLELQGFQDSGGSLNMVAGSPTPCLAVAGFMTGSAATDPISSVYPVFTPAGVDDEFSDNSFTGWTLVDDGTHTPTVTESNNVCSVSHPGGDTAAHIHAWLKATTVSVGDIIECAFRGQGRSQNFNICGLTLADGTTYGAGKQFNAYFSPAESGYRWNFMTGFNAQTSGATFTTPTNAPVSDIFVRLKYEAANTFSAWMSPDGVSWINYTGSVSQTMTPSAVGFFVSTWGGTLPFVWTIRYFRKTT